MIGFVYFASYTYFTSTYFPWMPNAGKCAGEEFAAFAGIGILSSYLLLFISFYIATYKTSGKPRARKAARSLKDAQIPDVAALTQGKLHSSLKNGSVKNGFVKNGSVTTSTHTPNGYGGATRSRKA